MPEHSGHPVSRRRFLSVAAAGALASLDGVGLRRASAGRSARLLRAEDPASLSPFERLHFPILSAPLVTTNGGKVPITIEMTHPMEPDHHITRVHVVNERDPVPSKGVFLFSPANGQIYFAYQVRLDEGASEISVTAECTLHGRWTSTRPINVAAGGGGCAAPAPPPRRTAEPGILPPRLRIPQLIKHGRIRRDELIDVQLTMRHPNRTGLGVRGGTFVQETEPFFLQEMEVLYTEQPVTRFWLTSALSDDPLITLRLRARHDGVLRIVLANNRGQRFEAAHQLRLA